ncbi:MAG: calcium/sodium antiporter [Dehalococcoidia bacterium]|nr:calcium/sodium antiporter [Dehalococcoidia bacterium]
MQFILLLGGLALIIKSADTLIEATSSIALRYGVSTFVVGITIIAFGTSAPELVVGLVSAISKTNELSLGNIIGASFANAALIVGIAAIIFPLAVKNTVIKRELPMLIFVQCVLGFMILGDGKMTRVEGIVLLLGFVGFIVYIIKTAKGHQIIATESNDSRSIAGGGNNIAENTIGVREDGSVKLWILSAIALIGLFVGGRLAVDSSTRIAESLGLSETIIGLTVVAIATTMPELMTSIMAARKKEPDLVLGNCIGSILFNILLALGLSAAINPIAVQGNMALDILLMILLTVAILIVALVKKRISRVCGTILVAGYAIYLGFKVVAVFL